jgi:hypothetical protein
MRLWAYRLVVGEPDIEDRERQLNELGRQGWELVAVQTRGGDPALMYLRRPGALIDPAASEIA